MVQDPEAPADHNLFPTLEREHSLADRVTEHLEQMIVEGQLQSGTRLPPERHLANQFGVSRTVVREAVRALAAKGLLRVQPGSGTIIQTQPFESAAESMGMLLSLGLSSGNLDVEKVAEVRRVLEVEIAGISASRATADDIAHLEAILAEAEQTDDDQETFVRTDVAFHAALARATQNPLFSVILDSIGDVLVEIRRLGSRVSHVPMQAAVHHRKILEHVKRGDVEGARMAMDRHMDEARDTMIHALKSPKDPEIN